MLSRPGLQGDFGAPPSCAEPTFPACREALRSRCETQGRVCGVSATARAGTSTVAVRQTSSTSTAS